MDGSKQPHVGATHQMPARATPIIAPLAEALAIGGPLAPMADYPQFLLWSLRDGRKMPISPHTFQTYPKGSDWQSDPAAHCTDAATVCGAAQLAGPGHGIGFLLTEADPFFCVDLDHCLQPDGASWSPVALDVLGRLPGAAVEVSQSGQGLHVFGVGTVPDHACKNNALGVELYTSSRFIALTGTNAIGDASTDCSAALPDLVASYFPAKQPGASAAEAQAADWTDAPEEGWRRPPTREEILARCNDPFAKESAPAVFGGRWRLHELWAPDWSLRNGEHLASEPRSALLCRLMYLAGGNCEMVYDIALEHGHCLKDDRDELLRAEIRKARALFLEWWRPEKARRDAQLEEAKRIGEEVGEPVLPTVLTLDGMRAELVYIESTREVFHRGTGRVRTAEAAKGTYAASRHHYVTAEGKTRDAPALPLWLSDPGRLSVDTVTWNPAAGEFCTPPDGAPGNTRAVNTWRGLRAHEAPEGAAERVRPFLEHVAYLVPIEAERGRFLQWLAHIVQRPGELPHTGYLMTTGETGIGRNWLASVLARVLPGHVAVGVPLGSILDGKFNGRLSQKLLAVVDEAREGMSGNRYERGEALKKLITEEHREINPKYGHMRVEFNCCRWLMFSNHDDALPFEANDRRFIVIANPTERQSPEYYQGLYSLLGDAPFIASIRWWLERHAIAGFNPGEPAPMSDAKRRVVEAVASGVDRAVTEFKAAWPAAYPVAPLRTLRQFIEEATGAKANDAALRHAMNRAGLVVIPGRRVRIGQGLQPERLVSLTADDWSDCSNVDLARIAEHGEREFSA